MPIIATPKDSRNQDIHEGDLVEFEGQNYTVTAIPEDAAGVVTIEDEEGWQDVADFQVTVIPF